nr:glycosyltransferase [Photobacterium leiognathi]
MIKDKLNHLVNSIKTFTNVGEVLVGHIDYINGQNIGGWAASNKTERTINVGILCDGKLIAKGYADLYREDLKEHGIHDGEHGFNLFLSEDELPENCQLQLIDINSTKPITKINLNDITCENHFIANGSIKLTPSIQIEEHGSSTVTLENIISSLDVSFGKKYPHQSAEIPTPWMYLKDSANTPDFMSMNIFSNKRFESLKYHLEAIAKGDHYISAEDITKAHQIVVEGYENRNKFPAFSLPKFAAPKVSIIVPAYNKFNLTYHCIASIALAYNKTSYEIILADDCSTDETTKAEDIIKNLVISRNDENLRFLKSCNKAAQKAKGQYIVMLNNDTEVTSYWLDELINKFKDDQNIGMTGSKLLNLNGTMQEAGGIVWKDGQPWNVGRDYDPLAPEFNYARDVDYLTGAAMCIRTDVWLKVGAFSEELAPCYYEDTDIAFKVREAGYRTVYVPHSEVVHFEGQSHGTDVTKGLKRNQVVNESRFRAKWYKQYKHNGTASLENMMIEKDRNIDQRILVIDYATPVPNKDAGSYAAVEEIKLILSLGFKVTFVPENLAHFGKYTRQLQRMGVEVLYAPFYTSMDDILDRRLPEMDAVYITRYHVAEKFIDRIQQQPNIKVIFNNADLHFLRELRGALKQGTKDLGGPLQTRDQELAVCRKADAILCYNTTEHAVITSHILESEKMHLTPWVLHEKSKGPEFKARNGIAFLGGFNHTPNGEAVEYLVNDIMPLLEQQRPEIKLYVYGSNMPASYKEMEADNIKMIGFAETLDSVYHDHRVFVAPLLSGAGIKGKVLESMAYNLPTVLTEVAAEGTGLTHGISTLIAQEPQEWVDAIIKLYDDELLWTKFAENSQVLVDAKYSFEHGHKVFKDIFASVGIYSSK